MKLKKRKIKINKPIVKHKSGDIIEISCYSNGVPTEMFWRRRLKDAEIDSCVEWVKDKPKTKEK